MSINLIHKAFGISSILYWTRAIYDDMKHFLSILSIIICMLVLSCSKQPGYNNSPISGDEVVIDASTLHNQLPKFFTYRFKNRNINFFLLRMDDRILSFADACVTCYKKKRGYYFDSGYIVCRACNQRYALDQLEQGFGGCYPIRLEGFYDAEKNTYRIPITNLRKLAGKF